MYDVIAWIIIGSAIALVFLFFWWALCVIAGREDDVSEKYWKQYWEKENTKEEDDGEL